MSSDLQVNCPTCRQRGAWFTTLFGPFCSQRCKLIDLGKWFAEEHTVSSPLRPEHLEAYAERPNHPSLDQPERE